MMAISSRSPAKSKVQERIVEDFLYVDNAALLFLQISGTSLWLIESVPAVWAHHQSEEDCSAPFRCRARIFHQWCTPWEFWQMFGRGIHRGLQERSVRFGKATAVFGKLEKNISRSMLNSECTRHACWVTYFTALRRRTRTDDRQTNSASFIQDHFCLKECWIRWEELSLLVYYGSATDEEISTMEGETFQMRKTACYRAIMIASTHKLILRTNRKYSSRICESQCKIVISYTLMRLNDSLL